MEASKIALIVCFGLSAVGVGTDFWLRNEEVKAAKAWNAATGLLRDIEINRLDIEVLEKEKEMDSYSKLKSNSRLREFFEQIAIKESKMERPPSVSQPQEEPNQLGYTDTTYELKWGTGKNADRFPRDKIAAFLWHIENKTSLLKVTYLKLQTDPKSRDDLWEPTIGVTERRPVTTQ